MPSDIRHFALKHTCAWGPLHANRAIPSPSSSVGKGTSSLMLPSSEGTGDCHGRSNAGRVPWDRRR